jgi:hypothetical protein
VKIHRVKSGESPAKREEIIGAESNMDINRNSVKNKMLVKKMQMLTVFLLSMI